MGKVYLAKDKRFGEPVVVKVPTMEAGDKDLKDRFIQEIKSLRKLQHAHIVPISDCGEIEGIPFLVLRYLSGGSLRDRITDAQGFYKPMPLEGLNQWLLQIASALDFIHTKNWVHRDLKPDNILFDEAGNPYLADFGIAKALEVTPMGVKTTMGAFIGTAQYMAPEMHLGKGIGPRADQFGLAVLVYEALAGKIPFAGATSTAIFVEMMQGKAKPIHELVPGIPLEKSNALMKGITKEPKNRYGSCLEFANAVTGSMLAKGTSQAGSEKPLRPAIAGTRAETQKKPDIPGTRIETPSKPGILGTMIEKPPKIGIKPINVETRIEPSGVNAPVVKKTEIKHSRVPVGLVVGAIMLFVVVIAIVALSTKGTKPEIQDEKVVKNTEEEGHQARLKQEEDARAKKTKLARLKQEEEMKAQQMELARLKQEEEAKAKQIELARLKQEEEAKIEAFASIEKEMVLIPAGKFKMGSPVSEEGRDDYETQHEVTLTKPFYMGKYEVTQDQWEVVMGNNPSDTKGTRLPVTDVSWNDCQEFIKKLNQKTNGGYRLPTEAEWEYACRAGTSTAYSYGFRLTKSDANISGSSTKAVGSYKANGFGLYDMHGNVWEWCEDWFGNYPLGSVTDPKGPVVGENRVGRGGAFKLENSNARSSGRAGDSPTSNKDRVGFRLARKADIKTAVAPIEPKPDPTVAIPAPQNLLVAPFSEAKAKEVQKTVAKSLQKEVAEKVDLGKGVKLEMVLIPAGKFKMGSPASEEGRADDEVLHDVTISKLYYMSKYEVMQDQWQAVMGDNPSFIKGGNFPITRVSWEDCQEFIKKLNAITNASYRLPTEAEWEYACRAGTSTAYSFGDSLTKGDANIGGSRIKVVGSYKPNAFGLYDMHGNVWEWCENWKAGYPAGAVTDPNGPELGTNRVLRGGSFGDYVSSARSSIRNFGSPSNRSNFSPTYRFDAVGFRLARTP